jgi:ubiquinone/menaquinone biosynthesis C-methylase UbiE
MERLLANLRAVAEPTRLRLLALAARGSFCVMEFTEILGQSQPRLSRHLKLLGDCGLLERVREGANVWFTLPQGEAGALARDLIARLPNDDAILESDRRLAARVLAERARVASESFRSKGADWDEMRALELPAQAVEAALLDMIQGAEPGRLLDIGTGTGRVLELLAPHFRQALGIDASKAMLALARARLAQSGLTQSGLAHCAVRQADMYRLPLADASFDTAVLQMVLHYAEDPAGVVAEAARVLRPGGRLIIIDLALHARDDLVTKRAHRWPGFSDAAIHQLLSGARLDPGNAPGTPPGHRPENPIKKPSGHRMDNAVTVPGPLDVRIWCATRMREAAADASLEHVN